MSSLRTLNTVGIIGPCPPPHGGVTRLISNNVKEWNKHAIRCILAPLSVPKQIDHKAYSGMEVHDHRLREHDWINGMRVLLPIAARLGAVRPKTLFMYASHAAALIKTIRRENIQVLYAHHALVTGAIAVAVGRITSTPTVLVSYGETWLATPEHRAMRRIIKYALRNADHIITTSEHCRKGALLQGARESDTSTVYAGIDLERFKPGIDATHFRNRLNIPNTAIVVSMLGITLRSKIETFVRALKPLCEKNDVYVLIGGSGKDEGFLRNALATIPGGRAIALGFVAEADLPLFYSATDILVIANATQVECMGQSMKEAMACGIPVVGSNIGGVPEAIRDGENGYLFAASDSADLISKIDHLVSQPQLRKRMGIRAREIAVEKFDRQAGAEQTRMILHRSAVKMNA